MKRCVFLDRDGVLNRATIRDGRPYPPADAASVVILPGVVEALATLHAAGFLLVVVSNQPDVARGVTSRAEVEAINAVLAGALPIDRFMMCYEDGDDSPCRKPRPGMLLAAAAELDIDLARSFMVGDRWRDVDAGRAAGCRTVFIDYNYAEPRPVRPDFTAASLLDAVAFVMTDAPFPSHAQP